MVIAAFPQQLLVLALLHDPAVPDHQDQVGLADGGQAVCDEEGGAVPQQMVDGVLDELLGLGVDGRGGLIQHKDPRVGQHRPGKGDQLLFAGGEAVAALAHVAVPALFQLGHHGIGRHRPGGGLHFLVGGVQTAVADVLPHGAGEQVGVLQHIADVGVQPQLAPLPVIHPVDEDLSPGGFKEPAGQIHQGALARTGLAHDGHRGALRDVQGKVLQYILAAVGIAEGYIPELDLAPQRLPIFLFGVEGIAVFGLHLRGVLHLGLLVQQVGDPLDGGLQGDELGDVGRRHLDGLEDAHRVAGKGRQGGQLQHLVQHQIAAPQQHDGHRHGAEKQYQRDVNGVEPGGPDAGILHLGGELVKSVAGLVLHHQGLGGLGAGDAFVKGAGDAGVQLAHLSVPVEDAVLEISGEHRHDGHDEDDHQGQLPVEQQHGNKAAAHVKQRPQNIGEVPGDHAGDAVGVAHDPGQQIAHRGHVVEGKGQGLQMVEQLIPHIPAHEHLDAHGVPGKGHHRQRLQHDDRQIGQGIGPQALQRASLDKIADGVPLEQRQYHVHQGAYAVEHQHSHKVQPVGPEEGRQPLPDPQVKGLCIVLFVKCGHYCSPPSRISARSSARI